MKMRNYMLEGRLLGLGLIVLVVAIAGGCESAKPASKSVVVAEAELPQVPSAMMFQRVWHGGQGLASDVLPSSGAMELYAPRYYPVAYGPIQLEGASGYRVYTYDSQAISTLGNTGWRTRYVVQTGITVP